MDTIVLSLKLDKLGGAERVVIQECNFLNENGHNVYLLTSKISSKVLEDYDLSSDVKVICLNGDSIIRHSLHIRSILRDIQPDFVNIHYKEAEFYLAQLGFSEKPKIYIQVHGSPFWFKNNSNLAPHLKKEEVNTILKEKHMEFQKNIPKSPSVHLLKVYLHEFFKEKAYKSANIVFATTPQVKHEIKALYGIDSKVIYEGISNSWINQKPIKINLTDHEYSILTVSRLDERKRIDILINAMKEVDIDAELIIVGKGEDKDRLKKIVKKQNLEKKVRFEGYIPDEKLPNYYASADLFATTGWISYGLTPLEAYLMNTKVLISEDVGAKYVLDGLNGVKVIKNKENISDKIEELLVTKVENFDTHKIPRWNQYCNKKFKKVI
ncbi:Glycosyltransferase, AglL family [Methanonatronarchaeum thermophilum]|uniref:Glycosyltransferase, AglL family n=1 Tax=Methanonatronarchaeum thermophilum TaxID=1927129 RepID=A0A1Y3GIQ5_9EURY|nr:glycosyltransferase family 4 protein [Methanonatronarchaeum thermophilum]OUJ19315.1 Glycosyltransferase, AglL family [Methanonatronarchaeum thermophilum]